MLFSPFIPLLPYKFPISLKRVSHQCPSPRPPCGQGFQFFICLDLGRYTKHFSTNMCAHVLTKKLK